MNKLFVIIVLFLFIGFLCHASNGTIDSFVNKIIYLKDWVLDLNNIKQEFNKELGELKIEIPQLIVNIKGLLPSK
jgi:hypothetical protein